MRDCPDCGAVVDGLVCPKCGRNEPGTTDGGRLQCAHVDRGQRCARIGTLTSNIVGDPRGSQYPHPGPFYCAEHFPPFAGRGYGKPRTAPPGGFKALRDWLGKPVDPEAIAEREAIRAESLLRAERDSQQ